MPSRIIERIQAESGVPELLDILAERLPPTDLQSLLLEAYRRRALSATPAAVLARASALTAPSDVSPRLLHEVEDCAFAAAGSFEAVELSPSLPLGAQAALGGIDQNNVLTTIRNTEVPGDPTTGLALEAAKRRRGSRQVTLRLGAAQRVVRMQPFDTPGFSPHFRLFCLASAGRDSGAYAFELEELRQHIAFYLRFFRLLNARGFALAEPLVEITDHRLTAAVLARHGIERAEVRRDIRAHLPGGTERFLEERGLTIPEHSDDPARDFPGMPVETLTAVRDGLFPELQREFPEAALRPRIARLEGFGYYPGLCLRIAPRAPDGNRYPIGDGGFVDWTAHLLANAKERLLSSGIGTEFICRRYRA